MAKKEVTQFSRIELQWFLANAEPPKDPAFMTVKEKAIHEFAHSIQREPTHSHILKSGGFNNILRIRVFDDGTFDFALKIPRAVLDEAKRKELAERAAQERAIKVVAEQKKKDADARRQREAAQQKKLLTTTGKEGFDAAMKQRREKATTIKVEKISRNPKMWGPGVASRRSG